MGPFVRGFMAVSRPAIVGWCQPVWPRWPLDLARLHLLYSCTSHSLLFQAPALEFLAAVRRPSAAAPPSHFSSSAIGRASPLSHAYGRPRPCSHAVVEAASAPQAPPLRLPPYPSALHPCIPSLSAPTTTPSPSIPTSFLN